MDRKRSVRLREKYLKKSNEDFENNISTSKNNMRYDRKISRNEISKDNDEVYITLNDIMMAKIKADHQVDYLKGVMKEYKSDTEIHQNAKTLMDESQSISVRADCVFKEFETNYPEIYKIWNDWMSNSKPAYERMRQLKK